MKIRVKDFEGAIKLKKIEREIDRWYANKEIFVEVNERAMVPLGLP